MILTTLLALATLVMRLFPQTPAARWLHLHMVELPLALIARLERKHILFLIVAVAAAQPLMMMGAADLAMIAAWDMAIYADVTIAVYAAAALARTRAAIHQLRSRATAWLRGRPVTRARPRTPSAPRRRPEQATKPANDDDRPAPPLRLAA
jgi:hypothetical protein